MNRTAVKNVFLIFLAIFPDKHLVKVKSLLSRDELIKLKKLKKLRRISGNSEKEERCKRGVCNNTLHDECL